MHTNRKTQRSKDCTDNSTKKSTAKSGNELKNQRNNVLHNKEKTKFSFSHQNFQITTLLTTILLLSRLADSCFRLFGYSRFLFRPLFF